MIQLNKCEAEKIAAFYTDLECKSSRPIYYDNHKSVKDIYDTNKIYVGFLTYDGQTNLIVTQAIYRADKLNFNNLSAEFTYIGYECELSFRFDGWTHNLGDTVFSFDYEIALISRPNNTAYVNLAVINSKQQYQRILFGNGYDLSIGEFKFIIDPYSQFGGFQKDAILYKTHKVTYFNTDYYFKYSISGNELIINIVDVTGVAIDLSATDFYFNLNVIFPFNSMIF